MGIFNILSLAGGLALFLYGMNIMSNSLERTAGGKLKGILSKLTNSTFKGLLLGMGVTAAIQSSSAVTVMTVGFVNSGIITLRQAIGIIMGANIGTTVTSWILSLSGISGSSVFMQFLKPASFTPILALVGICLFMFSKMDKKKNVGSILLGFAVLMFGMETMSAAVEPLADIPAFTSIFTLFSNPIIGVLLGALVTAVVQSSSASVGILQALSATGSISITSTIPIVMGQNIGTCVTALISSVGTNRNARRAAMVHLYFNIIGTAICMAVFYGLNAIVDFHFVNLPADHLSIAITHTLFNVISTAILLPFAAQLERLAIRTVPGGKGAYVQTLLDERLLATPSIAVEQGRNVLCVMAELVKQCTANAFNLFTEYNDNLFKTVAEMETESDKYEDEIDEYLVKLGEHELSDSDTAEVFCMLHSVTDFERIADHGMNLAESAKELNDKGIVFSKAAASELDTLRRAVTEVISLAVTALVNNSLELAKEVEPLEEVIDSLALAVRDSHIKRLSKGECTVESGFILNDIVINLERISDHCSNIALCVIENATGGFEPHSYSESLKDGSNESYNEMFRYYNEKFSLRTGRN